MDRHLTLVLLTAVMLAVGVMPGTATNGSAQMEDGDSMGHSVSSFMQVSAVEADSTVDQEMWKAAFENADNESEKAALIEQRSEQLSQDISTVHAQKEQLKNGTISQAYIDALSAHVTELRQSVQNTSQTANESNVSSNSLSALREEACSVPVSGESEIVVASNGSRLRCPPNSPGNTTTNNTTETPQNPNGSTNNTTETPQNPDGPTNNTTETPQNPNGPTNNTTETPQNPDGPTNNTTETPQNPDDSNRTETPQNPNGPTNNTTETPRETVPTTETETTNDTGPIFEYSSGVKSASVWTVFGSTVG